ncbi:MAG: hypothetical protein HFJ12_01640 [Bacilli bacterium]|nr:hypothetical protein [Bacilli bacterium]
MYSHEIEQLLKLRKFLLSREEYLKVIDPKKNTQISFAKYDSQNDNFEVNTTDNYNFKFKVKRYVHDRA